LPTNPQSAKLHDATIVKTGYASCKSNLCPLYVKYQYDGKLRKRSRLLIGGSGACQDEQDEQDWNHERAASKKRATHHVA
jgi:hypothetical protein